MKIDRFNEVVTDQLSKLGGEVTHQIKPTERGYTLLVGLGGIYVVSRYYSEPNISTISEQLVRVQVTHLYKQLGQNVIDTILGEGKINVI